MDRWALELWGNKYRPLLAQNQGLIFQSLLRATSQNLEEKKHGGGRWRKHRASPWTKYFFPQHLRGCMSVPDDLLCRTYQRTQKREKHAGPKWRKCKHHGTRRPNNIRGQQNTTAQFKSIQSNTVRSLASRTKYEKARQGTRAAGHSAAAWFICGFLHACLLSKPIPHTVEWCQPPILRPLQGQQLTLHAQPAFRWPCLYLYIGSTRNVNCSAS